MEDVPISIERHANIQGWSFKKKRSGSQRRQLNKVLNVRMTPNMFERLRELSEKRGITSISLCREILSEKLDGVEQADIQLFPRVEQFDLPDIVQDIDLAREAAAEATGMLKLAAQRYRESGQTELHTEAEAILAKMKRATYELLDLTDCISNEWREFMKSQKAIK